MFLGFREAFKNTLGSDIWKIFCEQHLCPQKSSNTSSITTLCSDTDIKEMGKSTRSSTIQVTYNYSILLWKSKLPNLITVQYKSSINQKSPV